MRIRRLGRTGLKVSNLCLGAMTFGNEEFGCDEDTARGIINRFLDAGGNFIDTADVYSQQGRSEEILGRALKGKRHQAVVATKCAATTDGQSPRDVSGYASCRRRASVGPRRIPRSPVASADEWIRLSKCVAARCLLDCRYRTLGRLVLYVRL